MLEEKFADQMWLGELVTRIEKEEQEMCIRDCEKEEMVLQMYDALKRSVEKATVSYELNAPFKSMGYVSLVGKSVDVFEPEIFACATKLADNVEMYPKTDGTVQINFSFHGLMKRGGCRR